MRNGGLPPPPPPPPSQHHPRRVYFGNLPFDVTEKDLGEMAGEFGKVKDLRVTYPPLFFFVNMLPESPVFPFLCSSLLSIDFFSNKTYNQFII